MEESGMILAEINDAFILHRQVCKTCGSDGPALCRTGLNLLLQFQLLLVAEVERDMSDVRRKGEAKNSQAAAGMPAV
jgi:hypothetical protein